MGSNANTFDAVRRARVLRARGVLLLLPIRVDVVELWSGAWFVARTRVSLAKELRVTYAGGCRVRTGRYRLPTVDLRKYIEVLHHHENKTGSVDAGVDCRDAQTLRE